MSITSIRRVAFLMCLVGTVGCDRSTPPSLAESHVKQINLISVASLAPARQTLLSPTGNSDVFLLQPDARIELSMLNRGDSLVTASRLVRALGSDKGTLSIRAFAPLGGGRFVIYASGDAQRRSLVSLWVYQPTGDVLTLVADSAALAGSSGLGDSIDIADAQFVPTDRGVWLCLYHSDAAAFFLLPPRLESGSLLQAAFTRLRDDSGNIRIRRGETLFAQARGAQAQGLGLLRGDGQLLAIDDFGHVSELPPPDASAQATAPPLVVSLGPGGNKYTLNFCVNDGPAPDPFGARPSSETSRYPKLIVAPIDPPAAIDGHGGGGKLVTIVIDRDAISVRPGFPVHALRITAWCQDPASGDVIAYDAFSGEVMRMKIDLGASH